MAPDCFRHILPLLWIENHTSLNVAAESSDKHNKTEKQRKGRSIVCKTDCESSAVCLGIAIYFFLLTKQGISIDLILTVSIGYQCWDRCYWCLDQATYHYLIAFRQWRRNQVQNTSIGLLHWSALIGSQDKLLTLFFPPDGIFIRRMCWINDLGKNSTRYVRVSENPRLEKCTKFLSALC